MTTVHFFSVLRRLRRFINAGAICFWLLVFHAPVYAALGGNLGSVQHDQSQLQATRKITQIKEYAVHEIMTPNGTVVREYVTSAGRVFGVAWDGPFMPNIRDLLGTYFSHFARAAQSQRNSQAGRRTLDVREPGLVVQTAGHVRSYYGRAYDPALIPTGVNTDEVR